MHGASSSNTNPSNVQGICPTGWHLPSESEWNQLIHYVNSVPAYLYGGDTANNAKALAATTGWDNHNNGDDICSPNQNQNLNNAT